MATVEIGPPLRRFCDGRTELQGAGTNVLEVLLDASAQYPALQSRVFRDDTQISATVLLYRGDGSIIFKDRETTAVVEGDRLRLYMFVAGG